MKEKLKRAINILNIADIHFGKKNDKKLYDDLKHNFLDEIPNIIKEYDHIDLVVIEGDLFDRVIKMSESSSAYVIKFIEELLSLSVIYKFKVRILKGTRGHDYNQLNNFNHLEITYPNFKIINVAEKEELELGDYSFDILYLPEEYPEDYKSYYKGLIGSKKSYDFIFGHGMIDFVSFTGDDETKSKIKRNESVHAVKVIDEMTNYFTIFGHIHDFKNYKDKDKIMYVGSFERFSFADQEDKGFLLTRVDPETGETEALFYENENASVYKILDLSEYEFENTEDKIKFIESEKEDCDFLKVILPKEEENKDLLKGVLSSDIKVESQNKLPQDVVDDRFLFLINKELPIDKSIQKYIKLTTGKDISLDVINRFTKTVDSV